MPRVNTKVHSLCKQCLNKGPCFHKLKKQLMSALTSLERFCEEDLVFINWRLCRHCLQNEWSLCHFKKAWIKFDTEILFTESGWIQVINLTPVNFFIWAFVIRSIKGTIWLIKTKNWNLLHSNAFFQGNLGNYQYIHFLASADYCHTYNFS